MRNINGYQVETAGGFITVKRWIVYKDKRIIRVFCRFKDAKDACHTGDFSKGMAKDIY